MAHEPILIQYRTETVHPREGMLGSLFRLLSEHSLLAGFVGGLVGATIAVALNPGVVETAPLAAVALSVLVVLVWIAILRTMRPFFEQQTEVTRPAVRAISFDGEEFLWMEEDRTTKSLRQPRFRLYTSEIPDDVVGADDADDRPWPVWLTAADEDGRFVLETKVAVGEAKNYRPVPQSVLERVDERLPTHVASPLLILARNAERERDG